LGGPVDDQLVGSEAGGAVRIALGQRACEPDDEQIDGEDGDQGGHDRSGARGHPDEVTNTDADRGGEAGREGLRHDSGSPWPRAADAEYCDDHRSCRERGRRRGAAHTTRSDGPPRDEAGDAQTYRMGERDSMVERLGRARAAGVAGVIVTLDWSFSHGRDWGSPHIPNDSISWR